MFDFVLQEGNNVLSVGSTFILKSCKSVYIQQLKKSDDKKRNKDIYSDVSPVEEFNDRRPSILDPTNKSGSRNKKIEI